MIAELGHYCLMLATMLALALGVLPLIGASRRDPALIATARPAAVAILVLIGIAFACLANAFVSNDFSIELVARHSNRSLPTHFQFAATWGSHEGSMLLWVLMLAGWTGAVALASNNLSASLMARVLAVLGLIQFGLLLFLILTSNPFTRLLPVPADGRDLNPLLQDAGMVFHPPLLYMGYVGFAVAFAFAIAGLIEGRFDAAWARWARPWTTGAWCFLTLGICLGSFWAYYELGWGGWWFWDPVENASFMPWLVGTALIHSLAVTEKRASFRSWTVLLAIVAFSLSLLGTFLVRSGVLTSVHAFATDPTRGVFILAFLAVVVGGSLALFAWRAPRIGMGQSFDLISRESMLLANNILFVVAMAAVLLGTLYPLLLDTLDMGKISVGPPYFDAVFFPLMAPALFLMGIGPMTRWRSAELPTLIKRLKWAFVISLVCALLLPLTIAGFNALTSVGLMFGLWIVSTIAVQLLNAMRDANQGLSWRRLGLLSASIWGMNIAHLGIAAFVVGVTLVKSYEAEVESRMTVGQTIALRDYSLRFDRLEEHAGPNYDAVRGHFSLLQQGKVIEQLHPEKRVYRASKQPMTEAAIDRSLTRDIYLSMGEPLDARSWAIRLSIKPFVNWIWIGCVLMALGGLCTITDRRYRRQRVKQSIASGTVTS